MKRRPAVTLMEVLIAMFILAIGMMALLVLFPVGAVSMAQALKDDRCAYASSVAENVAIAWNVRYGDTCVNWAISNQSNPAVSQTGLVYVDPYGVSAMPTMTPYGLPLGGLIPRVAPGFVYIPFPVPPTLPVAGSLPSPALNDRWFSLQDDISFNQSGTPDISNTGGFVDRGRRYTYAYLLRRMPPINWIPTLQNPFPTSGYSVHLDAVVYSGRPVASLATTTTEWPFLATVVLPPQPPPSAIPPPTTNGLQVVGTTTAKRGGWILDVSPKNPLLAPRYPWETTYSGIFYRITNVVENGGFTVLETQQNLKLSQENYLAGQYNMNILIMDNVVEVFDKGFGWQQ